MKKQVKKKMGRPPLYKDKVRRVIYLEATQEEKLIKKAEELGMSVNQVVGKQLERYLSR